MIAQLFEDVKATPNRIRSSTTRATRRARHRVHVLRGQSTKRIWTTRVETLDTLASRLESLSDVPVVDRLSQPLRSFTLNQLEAVRSVPVDGFEEMNAKKAIASVAALEWEALYRARRWESENKNRKTVLAAIDRRLSRLLAPPVEWAQANAS